MNHLRPLWIAFGLLTRLPVHTGDARDDDAGRAVAFFPVVGGVIGMILAALAAMTVNRASASIVAVGLVACLAALTGGLHLDGVADVFDGLGGAHGGRERMLAIMRDSRIGAHGAVALILVLLAKTIALSAVVQRHDALTIVAFPAVARWAAVPLLVFFPSAREEGLGKTFNARASSREVALATAFVVALGICCGTEFIAPTLSALSVALAFGAWIQRRLGGLTGDVYGGAIELAEVTFLIAAGNGT